MRQSLEEHAKSMQGVACRVQARLAGPAVTGGMLSVTGGMLSVTGGMLSVTGGMLGTALPTQCATEPR